MRKTTKDEINKLLFEFLVVVVGVFVAMFLNDWNNNRNLKNDRKEILRSIKGELLLNKKQIEQILPSRKLFSNSLDSLKKTLKKSKLDEKFNDRPFQTRLPNWKGIGGFFPDNSMFEAGKFSQVFIGMNIELLQSISRTYSFQKTSSELHKSLLNKFYGINSASTYKDVLDLVTFARDEVWSAQFLLVKKYEETINLIDKHLK